MLWPVVHLAGESATALRLPSLAAFGAAIVVCGLVGARLGGRVVGVSAALLLAVCPFAVLHAQDARMYALAATGLAVVVAALGYGAVQVVRTLDRPDWEGAARYLDARTTDGRRIVFVGGQRNAASFLYYAPRYGVPRDRLPWTQEELDRLPPTLMIIDRDNDVGDLRAALGRLPAWVVEQGALSPGTQERFDRLLDTCETRSRSSFRAISVSLVTRCAPG